VKRTKVMLVCMVDSIHVARWLGHFTDQEVDFYLFPSGPNRRVHPQISDLVNNSSVSLATFSIPNWARHLALPLWLADRILSDRLRGWMLRRKIRQMNPDYLHALELQHAGYIAERALRDKRITVPLIATNYGSDIFWFQQYPKHLQRIRELLKRTNFYSAECHRDYLLAAKYGFAGVDLPLAPNAGAISGTDLERNKLSSSSRKIIAVKGYQEWVGRAQVVIQALKLSKDDLKDAEIVFFSCGVSMLLKIKFLKLTSGLNVRGIGKHHLNHDQILDLFSRSRVYVGVSLSDGLSTSSIEAMSMGAFPIQSDTSCASEWFLDGVSGQSFIGFSPAQVGEVLVNWFHNEELLESARILNLEIVSRKFSEILELEHFKTFYGLKAR